MNFGDQHTRRDNDAVEDGGDEVRDYLPHEEEGIYHVKFLPHRYPLQNAISFNNKI